MKWWLTHADDPTGKVSGESSMIESMGQSIMLTTVQDLVAWGRKTPCGPFTSDSHVVLLKWPQALPVNMMWQDLGLK